MPLLTVAIIARNEERFIAAALQSARPLAAELLVVLDPRTSDRTAAIAEAEGAAVVLHPFRSFPAQRNYALSLCRTPWLLFLDADEQLSPALCTELAALLPDADKAGYWLPRRNRYWRRWLKGGGWYPDHQLRLLQPSKAQYDETRLVHELVVVAGETGRCQEHLLHWNIASWRELREKQHRYAVSEAQTLWQQGSRARPHNLVLQPLREIHRRFIVWHGYRDGALGLVLSGTMAYYEWVKYVHLWGLGRRASTDGHRLAQMETDGGVGASAAQAALVVLIVSFNVRDLLRECVRSLETAAARLPMPMQIMVVDNASTDGSAAMIRREFPGVVLLDSSENLGFAGGNNVGLRALGFESQAAATADLPHVLLLNPDTVVAPDALGELWRALETQPDAIIIGPQLQYGDGTLQSSRRRWPTRATLFWEATLLEQWWPGNPWRQRYHLADHSATTPQRVDWLVGAALLVRGTAIQQGGLLDDGFWMYSEELEWQHRLQRVTGGTAWYWPAAQITHYEGKSSEQNIGRRLVAFNRSKLRYARLRWGPRLAVVFAAFLWWSWLMQWSSEAAKWLLGHKRPLRRERMRRYARLLRRLEE